MRDNSKTLLVENPVSFTDEGFNSGSAAPKCIIKIEGNRIVDIQETKSNLFDCEVSKMIGRSFEDILPKYQPDGKLSTKVVSSLMHTMQLGNPVFTTLQIKTPSNHLHHAEGSPN